MTEKRQFTIPHRAWYAAANEYGEGGRDREVTFGVYSYDGGDSELHGEMAMVWHEVGPQLRVFCDGWKVLNSFRDVLDQLEHCNDAEISLDVFCDILINCGFEDDTPYKSPYPPQKPKCSKCGKEL